MNSRVKARSEHIITAFLEETEVTGAPPFPHDIASPWFRRFKAVAERQAMLEDAMGLLDKSGKLDTFLNHK